MDASTTGAEAPGAHQLSEPDEKRFSTVRALCALSEIALVRSTDDAGRPVYIVSRWAWTRELRTLDEVQTWLERATGRRQETSAVGGR